MLKNQQIILGDYFNAAPRIVQGCPALQLVDYEVPRSRFSEVGDKIR